MNKLLMTFLILFTSHGYSQDVATLLRTHEEKVYNPKYKALTDLVVDIESSKMKNELNEQLIFGAIKDLSFRVYWTASPERVAVEINGFPEGFNEVKSQLKEAILTRFETIVPISLDKKFSGFKLTIDQKNRNTVRASDEKALNAIPDYRLGFGKNGVLERLVGHKPVGTLETSYVWDKAEWSEPRYYLKQTSMTAVDGPQKVVVDTRIEWMVNSGIALPSKIVSTTIQKISIPGSDSQESSSKEEITIKNARVNVGEALKWFLANSAN